MNLKRNRIEETNEFQEILINDREISEIHESEKFLANTIKGFLWSIKYAVIGVLIGIAAISIIIFTKIRSENFDIQFAKNMLLKNVDNVNFSNLSLRWDFSANKLALVMSNVIWKEKQILVPEIRLYPKLSSIFQKQFEIDKIAIINPRLELDYYGNRILVSNDMIHDSGKKISDLKIDAPIRELASSLYDLKNNVFDIKNAKIVIKNRGFVIGTMSDMEINNTGEYFSIAAKVEGGTTTDSHVSLKLATSGERALTAEFRSIASKYLKKFIDLPDAILGANVTGKIDFDLSGNQLEGGLLDSGKFKLSADSVAIKFADKTFNLDLAEIKGAFNKEHVDILESRLTQGKATLQLNNGRYYRQNNILHFLDGSSIKIHNCKLPQLAKSDSTPFRLDSAYVSDGEFKFTGVIALDENTENNWISRGYSANFSNASFQLNGEQIDNADGSIKYSQNRGEVRLRSAKLDGYKIKDAHIQFGHPATTFSGLLTIPTERLIQDAKLGEIAPLSYLKTTDGLFEGDAKFTVNNLTNQRKIIYLNGHFSANDPALEKYRYSIQRANIDYSNGELKINGSLDDMKKLEFQLTQNASQGAKFKITGPIAATALHALGMPKGILTGDMDIVLHGTADAEFVKINTKADITNTLIKTPILKQFKSAGTKGIAMTETIIRDGNAQTTFQITLPERLISGGFTSSNNRLMLYDVSSNDPNGLNSLEMRGQAEGEAWHVSYTGDHIGIARSLFERIKEFKGTLKTDIKFTKSRLFDTYHMKSIIGSLTFVDGNPTEARLGGLFEDGRSFNISASTSDGITSTEITSNSAGAIMSAMGITDDVDGGGLRLQFFSDWSSGKMKGVAHLTNFSMKNRGFIRNLLALTSAVGNSFDDNLNFNSIDVHFKKDGTFIDLTSGQAISPYIWLTFQGVYDSKLKNIKLGGSVVPMHMYLSQKQLWLSSYVLSGKMKSPLVEVSPLNEISSQRLSDIFDTRQNGFIFGT